MGIKTSEDLKQSIQKAVDGDWEVLWDIAVYKLYNYYMGTHIKAGSETDKQNEILFKELEFNHPDLHKEIEKLIDLKLEIKDLL